jgi:oligopeptide/dipeptide ABC transporter ATP-binding protein
MKREPYLVVRDFRVWFPKRRRFLDALRKKEPDYVRAVDGIDLTVGKGEIYCLVGESGCGKTTTGRGILRLVEPTSGDVFVDLPPPVREEYEGAKAKGDEKTLEAIRRHHSLSFKEISSWTAREVLGFLLAALVGATVSALTTLGAYLAIVAVGAKGWELLVALVTGMTVGFVATLPWVKMSRKVPTLVMPFALLGTFFANLLIVAANLLSKGQPVGLDSVLAGYGGRFLQGFLALTLLLEYALAAIAAWETARTAQRIWRRRLGLEATKIRKLRKTLQMIFQDPYESLNPKRSVYDTVAEPLIVNHVSRGPAETKSRVDRALSEAGLRPPKDFLFRYPHELSGGQRQRVSIASALVVDPDFIVADEPVSMLDISIRTEIVDLLVQLRKTKDLTYLFITHDLSLAWVLADRIGVMYLGKIVEEGPTEEVVHKSRHPYTKALVSVVPVADPDRKRERIILKGERPDPSNIPSGCRFHPRCPKAFELCGWTSAEVLNALRELAGAERSESLEKAALKGSGTFVLPGATESTETWVRQQLGSKSEDFRALRAIKTIERGTEGLRVSLHDFREPTLVNVAPDVQVSCHLYR